MWWPSTHDSQSKYRNWLNIVLSCQRCTKLCKSKPCSRPAKLRCNRTSQPASPARGAPAASCTHSDFGCAPHQALHHMGQVVKCLQGARVDSIRGLLLKHLERAHALVQRACSIKTASSGGGQLQHGGCQQVQDTIKGRQLQAGQQRGVGMLACRLCP